MILLDATILVDAGGRDDPLGRPCGRLLAGIQNGEVVATIPPEAIQDFAHV